MFSTKNNLEILWNETKKKKMTKKMKKRLKTKKKGGNVDSVLSYDCIQNIRYALIEYWGKNGNWRKKIDKVKIEYIDDKRGGGTNKKRQRTEDDDNNTTRKGRSRGILTSVDYIKKHPVICYLVHTKGLSVDNSLLVYNSEIKMRVPEYNHIIQILVDITDEEIDKINLDGIIRKIINSSDYYKKFNILQPSLLQIFILHYFLDSNLFQNYFLQINKLQSPDTHYIPKQRWIDYVKLFYKPDNDVKLFLNYDKLGSNHDEDLDERATFIVNRCIQNGLKSLHTIDGHGRLIVRIVDLLLQSDKIDMNSFDIFVYDINEDSNLWHEMTMPFKKNSKLENILEILQSNYVNGYRDENTNPGDDKHLQNYLSDKMFYLNFSGLENQGDTIYEIMQKLDKTKNIKNIMVSFSSARNGAQPSNQLYIELTSLTDNNNNPITKVTNRSSKGDFVTLAIDN